MSYFSYPISLNLNKPSSETKVSPDTGSQNWQDESTFLDSSTVPTYEEFKSKTTPKIKKKKSILKKKFSVLNSTEASCLLTDDESDYDESILQLTTTINNLDIKSTLIFNNNHLNINNSNNDTIKAAPKLDYKSKENCVVIENTPEKFTFKTPVKNSILKIPLETAQPKLATSYQSRVTPTAFRSPSIYVSASNLNESNEYVFYFNKITQTSFVFSTDESRRDRSREPSIIVLNDSIEEDSDSDNDTVAKKLVLNLSSSTESSPASIVATSPINIEYLDRLNSVTLRKSNKYKNDSICNSIFSANSNKRVSICGDGMTKEQLRIDETILDESENESDFKNGRIYSLYESVNESINDKSDSDKSVKQLTPVKITSKWSRHKSSSSDLTTSSSETPKRPVIKQKTSRDATKLKSDDATTSSDGKFEKFLSQFKTKKKDYIETNVKKNNLKNFIVDDSEEDEESSSDDSNRKKLQNKKKNISSSSSLTESSEDDNEQLFYIKTTKKLSEEEKSNNLKVTATEAKRTKSKISRSSLLNDSSSPLKSSDDSSLNSSSSSTNSSVWDTFRQTQAKKTFKTPTNPKRYENESRLVKTQQVVKKKPPAKLSFIESLSTKLDNEELRDSAVLNFMKKYKNKNVKNELLRECYNKLNEGAFENKLPKDMTLIWSSRLTATGGYCKNFTKSEVPYSEIHMSAKVCDTPERMRDVLAHEMCHAATFLINGILDGHGPLWKNWASRVNFSFKEIPKITVFHSYQIKKKFIYKCQKCASEIHRFSKSIDITKQICGICHGRFDLINANKQHEIKKTTFDDILNNDERGEFKTSGSTNNVMPSTPKQPNAFSQFVKDNYHSVKIERNISKHQDIMKELGAQFKSLSTKQN